MTQFNFDADASQESSGGDYTPVPDGEYVLRIVKTEYSKTSTKKHMLRLELEIDEGPYKGRKVWTNIVFNPKGDPGHGLTVQALKAFGFEHDGEFNIDTDDWNTDRTCKARLVTEDYFSEKHQEDRKKNVIPTAGFITDGDKPAPKARAAAPARAAASAADEVPF
jgi:hypothetical protein